MSELWQDLERMCGIIKHARDEVDLYEIRALLRRTQYFLDELGSALENVEVRMPGETFHRLIVP